MTKEITVAIRVTAAERESLKATAEARGFSLSTYGRQALGLPVERRGGEMRLPVDQADRLRDEAERRGVSARHLLTTLLSEHTAAGDDA